MACAVACTYTLTANANSPPSQRCTFCVDGAILAVDPRGAHTSLLRASGYSMSSMFAECAGANPWPVPGVRTLGNLSTSANVRSGSFNPGKRPAQRQIPGSRWNSNRQPHGLHCTTRGQRRGAGGKKGMKNAVEWSALYSLASIVLQFCTFSFLHSQADHTVGLMVQTFH